MSIDRRSFGVVFVAFAVVLLASTSLGQSVKVQVSSLPVQSFSSGAAITLNLAQANNQVNIWTEPVSGVDIGRVTITGGPAANGSLFVILGTGSFQSGDTTPTTVGQDWAGIDTLGMTNSSTVSVNLCGGINGNLTNTLSVYSDGSVSRLKVSRFDVAGQLQRPIDAGSSPAGFFVVEAGSTSTSGSITLRTGNMTRVQVSNGDLAGSVTAQSGSIPLVRVEAGSIRGDILARSGSIGSIEASGHIGRTFTTNAYNDPESATALTGTDVSNLLMIDARLGITSIKAASMCCSIEANNNVLATNPEPTGNLGFLQTTSGSFKGIMTATNLKAAVGATQRGIDIKKDYRGRLILSTPLSGTLQELVKVGRSMVPITINGTDRASFILPPNGLTSQVIVNADNLSGAAWTTPITVDGITFTPDSLGRYSQLPSQLGGGSIGLAPFRVHEQACEPVHDAPATLLTSNFKDMGDGLYYRGESDPPIKIRFYGPVTKATAATSLISHLHVIAVNPDDWCYRQMDVTPAFAANLGADGRTIGLYTPSNSTSFPKDGTYAVYADEGRILSVNVAGSNAERSAIWPADTRCVADPQPMYIFRIAPDCNPRNGLADAPGTMCTPVNCACDADHNMMVSVNDLFTFLADWFAQNGQTAPGLSADADGNGTVSVNDLFTFLSCWFAANGNTCD